MDRRKQQNHGISNTEKQYIFILILRSLASVLKLNFLKAKYLRFWTK